MRSFFSTQHECSLSEYLLTGARIKPRATKKPTLRTYIPRIDIRSQLDEQSGCCFGLAHDGQHQWSRAPAILDVEVSTIFGQQTNDIQTSDSTSPVQSCPAVTLPQRAVSHPRSHVHHSCRHRRTSFILSVAPFRSSTWQMLVRCSVHAQCSALRPSEPKTSISILLAIADRMVSTLSVLAAIVKPSAIWCSWRASCSRQKSSDRVAQAYSTNVHRRSARVARAST